jgi:hypothetical protein
MRRLPFVTAIALSMSAACGPDQPARCWSRRRRQPDLAGNGAVEAMTDFGRANPAHLA